MLTENSAGFNVINTILILNNRALSSLAASVWPKGQNIYRHAVLLA